MDLKKTNDLAMNCSIEWNKAADANTWTANGDIRKFLHGKAVSGDDDDDDVDPRWRVVRRGGKLVNATFTCHAFASGHIASCKAIAHQLQSAAKEVGRSLIDVDIIIIIIIITIIIITIFLLHFSITVLHADQKIPSRNSRP
jgi:hypothetical protein